MQIEHPELVSRLNSILGQIPSVHIHALSLKLRDHVATVEVKIAFEDDEVPPLLQKRSKNSIVFFLEAPDFQLNVRSLGEVLSSNAEEFIKVDGINFTLGRYMYQISAKRVHATSFHSVNKMDLIEETW